MIALDFPNAISSEERFYDRRQELNLILAALSMGQPVPVVVIGERRIGKTSIHNIAIQRLKETAIIQFIPLIIEPRGIQSVDHFVKEVLSRLSTWSNQELHTTGLVGEDGQIHLESPAQLDAAFQRLYQNAPGQRYLLCVDEFDEIIRVAEEAGEAERTKLMGLINYLVESTTLPLSLFLTMTRLPEGSAFETASPLMAKCELVELKPFCLEEMAHMVTGLVAEKAIFSQPEMNWLYNMSGGHPYITKLLLANLFQRVSTEGAPVNITREMLEAGLASAVDDLRANYAFENIYRVHLNADEKRVLLYLAERNEPVDAAELREAGMPCLTAAKNLKKRHYLVEQEDGYQPRALFIGCWLRNWAEFDEEIERLHVHNMVDSWLGNEPAPLSSTDY